MKISGTVADNCWVCKSENRPNWSFD